MKSLYRLVRRIQRGETVSDEEREALGHLVLAMSVAVDMAPEPKAPWTAPVQAYRELLAARGDEGDGGASATVVPLRPAGGGR